MLWGKRVADEPVELFSAIHHSRAADEIVQRIERLILDGVLRDGDRLPGERDLAARFNVSRPILREALKELEARGLLVSRHGGGTFVADIIGEIFSQPMRALIVRHKKAARDYLDYRREIEGLTAERAARHATPADRESLTRIVARMRTARDADDRDNGLRADIDFHMAVGESAHNIILLHTLRSCYRLLEQDIFFSRTTVFAVPGASDRLLEQHEAIHAAILGADAGAARKAAESHIDFVIGASLDAHRAEDRARIARLRLQERQQD
ncbi:FadR/GntR family transcriptional regulator [Rhizobium sp. 9140]|uniref:FadR/GntR family transcriptional regulator n=1 Tax=Rhizobium sp. 9140 TaxID=1761900 RepID=UPI00079804C0|nr:FadR/GntR family transcriptional regulator [Rhizobium sp. 9140]CZT34314.1 GntR family transcriptional regulator, transcriptional repressor for pyruvate dehydrogenase complex [Rhizobium sp. 9140]